MKSSYNPADLFDSNFNNHSTPVFSHFNNVLSFKGEMYIKVDTEKEYKTWIRDQPLLFLQGIASVTFFQGLGFILASLFDQAIMPLPYDPLLIIGTVYMLCGTMFLIINFFMRKYCNRLLTEEEVKAKKKEMATKQKWIDYEDPNPELSIFAGMVEKDVIKKTD